MENGMEKEKRRHQVWSAMSLETLAGILPDLFPFSVYVFIIRIVFVLLTSEAAAGQAPGSSKVWGARDRSVWWQVSSRPRAWEAEAQHWVDTELV